MLNIRREQLPLLILAAVTIAVFFSSFALSGGGLFLSPDEMANNFFAKHFAATGSLRAPFQDEFSDILFPRSVIAKDGWLPGGFIGLPVIYGTLIKIFGEGSVPVWTPLLAALAVWAWFQITEKWFGRRLAFYSALLLAIQPAWWYYGARFMMPNVPFVSLLIGGIFWLAVRPLRTERLNYFLSGIFFGAAVFVRPSELIWLVPAALIAIIMLRPKLAWRKWLDLSAGWLCPVLAMLFLNHATYGGWLATGYTVLDGARVSAGEGAAAAIIVGWWDKFQELIAPVLPFGLHPRNILRNFWGYGLEMFWWMSGLAGIGLGLIFRKKQVRTDRTWQVYLAVGAWMTGWLAIAYGSWAFHDNPDPAAITIANSYVRYWLPIFVLMTPLAATVMVWLQDQIKNKATGRIVVCAVLAAAAFLSVRIVFLTPGDGLWDAARTLERSAEIRADLLRIIPKDAVVIVDRGDKLLFPDRLVRQPLRDETTYTALPRLAVFHPLYYYGVSLPEADLIFLTETRLAPVGLKIELIKTYDAESLYQIKVNR